MKPQVKAFPQWSENSQQIAKLCQLAPLPIENDIMRNVTRLDVTKEAIGHIYSII